MARANFLMVLLVIINSFLFEKADDRTVTHLPDEVVGFWQGAITSDNKVWSMEIDILRNEEGELEAFVSLPDYGVYMWSCASCEFEADLLKVDCGVFSLAFEFVVNKDEASGSWSQRGRTATLKLRRVVAEPRTPNIHEFNFTSNDGTKLAGSLVFPEGDGPFPVVVWTHGSGPDTRETPHYAGRAHRLAKSGVASLIYDKRGSGQSDGEPRHRSATLIADALAAVDAVSRDSRIDPDRIAIGGFSQGAWISPAVAAKDKRVRCVIAGATPVVNGAEQNIFSLTNRLKSEGHSDTYVKNATDGLQAVYEYCRTGKGYEQVVEMLEAAKDQGWPDHPVFKRLLFTDDGTVPVPSALDAYKDMFADVISPWKNVHVPVLSMWGADDQNVPVQLSHDRLETILSEIGNSEVDLVIFRNATHGIAINQASLDEWDWPRLAPGFHDHLAKWVHNQMIGDSKADNR